MYALVNCTIHTGDGVERGLALVIEDGRIKNLTKVSELDPQIEQHDLRGASVAPGFIDIQVNGGGGVLFNDSPTRKGIAAIVHAHRQFGTTNLLPTYITGPASGMEAAVEAVRAVRAARAENRAKGVLGIHLEGPFLSKAKPGVHEERFLRDPNERDLQIMTSLDAGVTLVTLAPEVASDEVIAQLGAAGVLVSLGHSGTTCERARAAFAAGASCVTHLFNAMSPLTSRAPGVVGAALLDRNSWAAIIVDGFHVDFAAVAIAIRAKAPRKMLLVTDAMPPVGAPELDFRLGDTYVHVNGGKCVTKDGRLAGSALDMATAVRNCVQKVGLPTDEALRMASTYVAEFLGLGAELGRIAPSYRANLTVFNDDIRVSGVVVKGERFGV